MSRDALAFSIRPLRRQDVPAALDIQAAAYPPFLREQEEVFCNRIDMSGSYCLAAGRGNELLGYLLAHRWRRRSPPPPGTSLAGDLAGDVLFIHDLAIAPGMRGLGVGQRMLARAFELAARDGLRRAELIAVEGADVFWRRLGFAEESVSGELAGKLADYGTRARWMTRIITNNR